ncbi:hypothetical protein HY969_04400 [Candidatus Kaiserbacteria bacterium]|nr:hypothetical protein [Candidatus Kaiserbacteria bacterium]
MTKILIGLVVVLLLATGGVYVWMTLQPKPEPTPAPVTTPQPEPLETYASSTLGFSIWYPKGYAVNELYAYDQFGPEKLIHGVKFTIPLTMATGTNLSANDTGISVEWLPRAKTCTGDIYIPANVPAFNLTDGSVKYSIATTTGAAAGNFYEETVYALSSSTPCTAVRYFIHSGNIGNYATGTVREFDRAGLVREFDKIRQSLKFTR